ncbi:MAG TPA: MFS transporter [Azospirillaceae bacterium]|nr:MFS transporter [Azospirillaceae bacterium]
MTSEVDDETVPVAADTPKVVSGADPAVGAVPLEERIAVFLVGFAAFLPLYAPQSVLPQMAATLDATPVAAGSVIGATTLAVAIAAPVAGPLTDRFGRKRAMLAAIALLAPLTLLLTFCTDLSQLLAVRFLQGMVLPALFTGAVAYVTGRWRGATAASVMGLFVAGSAMGGFAGRFIAGLAAEAFGWQGGFAALALVSTLCAPVVWRWLPADEPHPDNGLATHIVAMFGHLRNIRICAAGLFGATVLFSMTGTLSYVGFHLAEPPFSLSPAGIGLVFLVYPIGAAIVPLNGRLLRRFGTRGALLGALTICATGQIALLVPHIAGIMAGIAIFITGIFLCQSLALGYVGRTARTSQGAAAGLYVSCFYIGGSLGAVLPGFAWKSAGWTGCVLLVCMALFIGALVSLVMREAKTQAAACSL